MSNEKLHAEAFKKAEEELLKQKVEEVKGYILKTLQKIEEKKKEKEKIEEEMRILKLDLEDLREGKFEKIKERCEKSNVARIITSVPFNTTCYSNIISNTITDSNGTVWLSATSGTYTLSSGKTFYF